MGFKDSLVTMVGGFVEMKKSPMTTSRTELSVPGTSSVNYPPGFTPSRRHSLSITVGTDNPPEKSVRQRTFSVSDARPQLRRDKSDTMSLMGNPSSSDAPPKPPRMGRRSSEPVNVLLRQRLVPEKLNLSNKKKRRSRADNISSDEEEAVESPRFTGSSNRFSPRPGSFLETSPIEEEWEAENIETEQQKKIAAGTEIGAEIKKTTATTTSPIAITRL
jgi:hypothetical protein